MGTPWAPKIIKNPSKIASRSRFASRPFLYDFRWILSPKCTLPTRVPLERARAKRVFAVFGRRQVWGLFWAPFSLHFRTFLDPQTSRKPPRNVFEIQTNFEAYFLTIWGPFGGPQGGPKNVKNQQKWFPDASCGFPGPLGVLLGVPKAVLEAFLTLKPRVSRGFLKPDTRKPRVLRCFSEARHGETMRLRLAFLGLNFTCRLQA